ncbi:hypothetical protein [Pontibacillus litoralis]|uniref:Uncharacterized protein n=1 Tax=Pontibacillus litoralis JSM 072002 TaxID=1385512 RepID=A0A0A5G123_9BACI|nr:hypothetical protein [Pontibacillus litoralis]KGX84775.1 hypothetical protein N784_11835 [Pontibacillus litoralis JSM 072002]
MKVEVSLLIFLLLSVVFVRIQRKKRGLTGMKSAIPAICLWLIALIHLTAYWINGLGVVRWMLTVLLLMIGGYYTAYVPQRSR